MFTRYLVPGTHYVTLCDGRPSYRTVGELDLSVAMVNTGRQVYLATYILLVHRMMMLIMILLLLFLGRDPKNVVRTDANTYLPV